WVAAYLTATILAVFAPSLVAAATPAAAATDGDICKGHTDAKTVGMPFAHPTVCNQFITCGSDGKPYVGLCPGGTFYDTVLTTCTAAAKSACGDRK
ncbi:hypothetical protein GGI24_002143, partial [Coemansia furcata]